MIWDDSTLSWLGESEGETVVQNWSPGILTSGVVCLPFGYGTLGWLRHTRVATPRRGSCLIHHSSLKFTGLWVGSYWEEICKKIQEIYRCPVMQLSDVGQAEKHVLSIYYALNVLL